MDRSAPDLARETPDALDGALVDGVAGALRERHGRAAAQGLAVDGRAGPGAAALCARLGDDRKAHEVFVFARGDGAVDRAVDYLDGLVAEIDETGGPDAGFFLPLDWEGRPFDDEVVFVRGEVRDYAAEAEAARLLGEAAPARGLR